MADRTLEVKCPCGQILIVNAKTGAVIETRAPILSKEESTGDRFEDARKKAQETAARAAAKFEAAKKAEKDKLARLDALFKDKKQEIEEEGADIERPDGLWDRD